MSSIFRSSIVVLLTVFGLALGPSIIGQKVAGSMTVACRISLDDETDIEFRRLRVSIQHRAGKGSSWTPGGSYTPDENGLVVITVPAGRWVSMTISTTDPTIRRSVDVTDEDVGFYRLEKQKPETVLLKEFYVAAEPSQVMEQTVQLQRGAAFSVCIPQGMKSGSVQFHLESEKTQSRIGVASFSDPAIVQRSVIGGLRPGQWEVAYVDNDDQIRGSQRLDLSPGQVLQVNCP